MGFLIADVEVTNEALDVLDINSLVSDLSSNTVIIRKSRGSAETTQNEPFDSLNQLLFCRGRIENQRGLLDKANLVRPKHNGAI